MMSDLNNTSDARIGETSVATWNLFEVALIAISTIVILLLGIFILNTITRAYIPGVEMDPSVSFLYVAYVTALEGIAIFASIFLIGRLRRKLNAYHFGLIQTNPKWYLIAFISALVLIPFIGLIALLIQYILGIPLNNPQLDVLVPKEFSLTGALATVIFGGFVVPVAEELLFRGILYQAIKNRFGIVMGVILSSLMFGALHGEVSIAGATFVMGLVLVLFYEKSKSLWPSIIIHVTNNSLKLLILYTMLAFRIDIPTI